MSLSPDNLPFVAMRAAQDHPPQPTWRQASLAAKLAALAVLALLAMVLWVVGWVAFILIWSALH